MRILVNGATREVSPECTLDKLVARRAGVAAAVNGSVVRDWTRVLHEGDEVEVLTAMQGG